MKNNKIQDAIDKIERGQKIENVVVCVGVFVVLVLIMFMI